MIPLPTSERVACLQSAWQDREERFSLASLRKYQIVSLLDMLNFPVPEFVTEMRKLSDMLTTSQQQTGPFFSHIEPSLKECLRKLLEYVTLLDLDASISATKALIDRLDKVMLGPPDHSEVATKINELRSRIEDQLKGKTFLFIPASAARFFSEKSLFGEKVSEKFPSAVEEVEEAGKCLALGRYSACVFHLMRVMEVGVQQFAKRMKVAVNVRDNWGDILSNLQAPIRAMPQGTVRQKEKRDAFMSLQNLLYAVKEAWRNNTMHPKATYTEEEANEIFNAVKVFMRRLAETI